MEKTASQSMEHEKTFMRVSAAFGAQKLQTARRIAIVINLFAIVLAGAMTLIVLGTTRTLRAVAAKLSERVLARSPTRRARYRASVNRLRKALHSS